MSDTNTPASDDPTDPDAPPQYTDGPMPGPPEPVVNTGPPLQPEAPVSVTPGLWYSATITCAKPGCLNYNRIWPVAEWPAGMTIVCGLCSTRVTILTATLLDPQPEED